MAEDRTFDLAYHHNNPQSRHQHSEECEPKEHWDDAKQFLRCLKVELDRIRADREE